MNSPTTKEKCTGCAACFSACNQHAIRMATDSEGFLYPIIDEKKCTNCGLCKKVCPIDKERGYKSPLECYAAYNPNEDIRYQSSSGGIFSMLAEQTINSGGIVFGAKFDKDWQVVFGHTDNLEGISEFRGSKYVQASINDSFIHCKKILKEGQLVLFTGTPCQINGLKSYLQKDYNNLVTIAVICHGAPSPLVWNKYLSENYKDHIEIINFRSKSNSWKKYQIKLIPIIDDVFYKNTYMHLFLDNYSLRPSCYNCQAKAGKINCDIVLGDFWGIEKQHPTFDDDKGCSAVIVNTEKGIDWVNRLTIIQRPVLFEDIAKGNPALSKSVGKPINRDYFFYCTRKQTKTLEEIEHKLFDNKIQMRLKRLIFRKLSNLIQRQS